MRVATLSAAFLVVLSTSAFSDKLPKSAKPLTNDEVKALYSDKTALWKKENAAYFGTDGTVLGIYAGGYFEGKWEARENEVCMHAQGTDSKTKKSDGKTYTDCWQWHRDGKGRYWTLWSTRHDGSKAKKSDYWKGEFDLLKDGNLIADKFAKAKGVEPAEATQ